MLDITHFGTVKIDPSAYVGPQCVIGLPSYQVESALEFRRRLGEDPETVILEGALLTANITVCAGSRIGRNVRVDVSCYIGSDTVIGDESVLEYGCRVYDRVRIGRRCVISGFVSNGCIIEDEAVVHGALVHKYKSIIQGVPEEPPSVGQGAVIGLGAVVVGGVHVAANSYVGAGAVLTHSTREGRLYLGVPAMDVGPAPERWAS